VALTGGFTAGFAAGAGGPGAGRRGAGGAGAAEHICKRESAVTARPVIMVLMEGMVIIWIMDWKGFW